MGYLIVARTDRRQRLALDESYKYYKSLEKEGMYPSLYELAKSYKTVTAGLAFAESGHDATFKMTRQLWKRMQQAMFDKMLTTFPGYLTITDEDGNAVEPHTPMPEAGVVQFLPDGCRRADDIFRMEIKHLYPGTQYCLGTAWKTRGAHIAPADFAGPQCSNAGCFLKPMLLGQEVLAEESTSGRQLAYSKWWDMYWQAYCSSDRHERTMLERRMEELENIWGELYY
jgi:hypothetical protein